jgi:hypothetical protein
MPRSTLPKHAPSSPTAPLAWFRLKRMFGLAADAGTSQATGWSAKGSPSGPMPKVTDYTLRAITCCNV